MPDSKIAGGGGPSTLKKKDVVDFSVSPDMARILGMKADPHGYNEEVNSVPEAKTYAERIQARAEMKRKPSGALKGAAPPLGHVEAPSSDKMKAIASLHAMPQPNFPEAAPTEKPKPTAPSPIRGVGAAYPVNQALASGQTAGPVTLREGTRMANHPLSKESVQALEMANKSVQQAQAAEPDAPPSQEDKKESPSVVKETRSELDDAEKEFAPDLPEMDFAAIDDARSMLMSKKRQKDIESRLDKLDLADMVMKRELTQTVTIVPNKLAVTLRTFSQNENLWIMKYIFDFPGSALYVQELINTCRLVCSVTAINGAYLPDHRKDVGTPSEKISKEEFEKKFYYLSSLPVQLVADLSVQLMWFQDRVNKLLTLDELKNG
jgi:hypothetical protein